MRTEARAVLSVAALAFLDFPPAGGPHPTGAPQKKTKVVLEKRSGGEYGNSTYSFFLASRDVAVHRNYADLLLNNCGLLHFNVYSGAKNRVARLGKVDFADVKKLPDDGWLETSALPAVGNVCVFDGRIGMPGAEGKYAVKFVVTAMAPDSITIEWAPLGDMPKPPASTKETGAAGAMGKCGTPPHKEK